MSCVGKGRGRGATHNDKQNEYLPERPQPSTEADHHQKGAKHHQHYPGDGEGGGPHHLQRVLVTENNGVDAERKDAQTQQL